MSVKHDATNEHAYDINELVGLFAPFREVCKFDTDIQCPVGVRSITMGRRFVRGSECRAKATCDWRQMR